MNISEIKHQIIAPTLKEIGLYSDTALDLVTGTGLVESGFRVTVQSGGGPALGWFQMEPATYHDIWENYLRYRTELGQKILQLISGNQKYSSLSPGKQTSSAPPSLDLTNNPAFSAAMCRVKYLRSPLPLPKNTAFNLCQYWKQVYNTPLGKGQVDDQHVALFQAAIDA